MKQTTAPKSTPLPGKDKISPAVDQESNPTTMFIGMALDMSWRLALVVLIPIVAGSYLDKYLKLNYVFLFIGLAIAFMGSIMVIYKSYKKANIVTKGTNTK